MKLFDTVRVTKEKEEYKKYNVHKGMIGTIIDAEIRFNAFQVAFVDSKTKQLGFDWENDTWDDDIIEYIEIKDLEVVEESGVTDDYILKCLPDKNPNRWCKFENGFIINLMGEKLNKKAYDYN